MEVKLLTSSEFIKEMENNAAIAFKHDGEAQTAKEELSKSIKLGCESILEHITLTYSVRGLSRVCLHELEQYRHNIALSVESIRRTLRKQLEDEQWVMSLEDKLFPCQRDLLYHLLKLATISDYCNDELMYYLPEFWPTTLTLTANIRELRHIIKLHTLPAELNEFRILAYSLYEAVPEGYRYLLEDCVYRVQKCSD